MSCSDEVFLQELLHRITNSNNETGDELAVEMFCALIQKNQVNVNLVKNCTDLIIAKLKSKDVSQALKALDLLDDCMSKCGPVFQNRISKYRFLNELIRLVSDDHEGLQTPPKIKNKIMNLLLLWVTQYPDKENIKSTYDSLIKKGVKHLPNTSKISSSEESRCCSLMTKEEEAKLKKLLQSKDNTEQANLLIQSSVIRDAKRKETKGLMKSKLQNIQNVINVLDEVLNRCKEERQEDNTEDSISLIKELKNECNKYRPEMAIIPEIIEANEEELLAQAIELNDSLLAILDKCDLVISNANSASADDDNQSAVTAVANSDDLLSEFLGEPSPSQPSTSVVPEHPLRELTDIFTNTSEQTNTNDKFKMFKNLQLLEPTPLKSNSENKIEHPVVQKQCETRLRELDKISEDLLKSNAKNGEIIGKFKKTPPKVSLNDLAKTKTDNIKEENVQNHSPLNDNVEMLTSFDNVITEARTECTDTVESQDLLNGEETSEAANNLLLNIKEIPVILEEAHHTEETVPENKIVNENHPKEVFKHLSDIHLDLKDIQFAKEFRKIMDNQDLEVILYFTLNKPSVDVSVIVVSTVNQSCMPMENYQLIASVRKPCKLRTLSPTGMNLPGVEPPQLPTVSIKQILLLYNPTKNPVDITFILGYTLGNDPDQIKESIFANDIPYVS